MAITQEEFLQAVHECLTRIEQDFKITFHEFSTETYTQGGFSSGKWTYNVISRSVYLEYWFSSFSSRKESVNSTYTTDQDKGKLENDLRDAFIKVRQFVNKKKGMF